MSENIQPNTTPRKFNRMPSSNFIDVDPMETERKKQAQANLKLSESIASLEQFKRKHIAMLGQRKGIETSEKQITRKLVEQRRRDHLKEETLLRDQCSQSISRLKQIAEVSVKVDSVSKELAQARSDFIQQHSELMAAIREIRIVCRNHKSAPVENPEMKVQTSPNNSSDWMPAIAYINMFVHLFLIYVIIFGI